MLENLTFVIKYVMNELYKEIKLKQHYLHTMQLYNLKDQDTEETTLKIMS